MNADDLSERHSLGLGPSVLPSAAVNFSSCTHATRPLVLSAIAQNRPYTFHPPALLWSQRHWGVSTWAEIRRPPHSVDSKLGRRRPWIARRTPSKLIHTMLVRDCPRKR